MARGFRTSRFRRRTGDIGEDVNPSAYIVNLADCMLVLACGFLVAMLARSAAMSAALQEVSEQDLQEVDADVVSSEDVEGGYGFVNAGTVWLDPATGDLYMIVDESTSASSGTEEADDSSSEDESADDSSSGGEGDASEEEGDASGD